MSIGGQLDYRRLAEMHRPANPHEAVCALAAQGLRCADIARILGYTEPAVAALLKRYANASGATRSAPLAPESAAALHAAAWVGLHQSDRGSNG